MAYEGVIAFNTTNFANPIMNYSFDPMKIMLTNEECKEICFNNAVVGVNDPIMNLIMWMFIALYFLLIIELTIPNRLMRMIACCCVVGFVSFIGVMTFL